MRRFFPGETVRVAITFSDAAAEVVDVAGVGVSWRRDGGAAVTVNPLEIVQLGEGRFRTDITVTEPGEYAVRATCATPSSAATEEIFVVVPSRVI